MAEVTLDALLSAIRACRLCEASLPLGPRPIVRVSATAKILIIGQAPGTKVHETGIPWNDPSGDRLRNWMGLDKTQFYDETNIAIMPMGFCYPGRLPRGGDAPPRPECAPEWHPSLRSKLTRVELTLLVGSYAQKRYLDMPRGQTMTATVAAWKSHGSDIIPMPHPSWRTTAWLKKNPWFEADVIPHLQDRIRALISP